MAKKKSAPAKKSNIPLNWNPDTFKYYFPVFLTFILIGVIILFSDFIFSNKMLYGSDMIKAGIFFRSFLVDTVHAHGHVPVWNPYIFGGMPYIDAFHGDIYYPLSMLKYFGSIFRSLGFNLVLHIFLAGIFMYFTARQFKLSRTASTLSAVGYMFSGLLVSLIAPGHDGKIFVTTLFPLTILFLDRAFEKKALLNFTMLGLVIGVIILSPHPQLSYYSLWAIGFYALFRLIIVLKEKKTFGAVAKPSILFIFAIVIGLFISAIQFYPGYTYTRNYSPRADSKSGYEWATSWSLHQEEVVSQVVPEFIGSDSGQGYYYWGKNAFKDNSEYVGVILLFLAMIGIFFYRKKEAIFFGCLALFMLIYALGDTTPLFKIFFYIIPMVKSLRAPSTIMFIFLFSVSLLAGMGMQYIIDRKYEASPSTKRKLRIYLMIVPGVLLLGALLFSMAGETMLSLYTSIFYGAAKTKMVAQGISKFNLAVMMLPKIQAGFWFSAIIITLVSSTLFIFMNRKAGIAILLFIPLLAMIDGIRFDSKFIKSYDYRQQFTDNALTQYLETRPEKFRVWNPLKLVGEDYLPYFGIEVVTGYHGNQLRWYEDLLGGIGAPKVANPKFLNLVNTRYMLLEAGKALPDGYLGPKPMVMERSFGKIGLYRNDNAFPRAFVLGNYKVVSERKDIVAMVQDKTTDLSKAVLLEKDPGIPVNTDDSVMMKADIADYAEDSVLIDVQGEGPGILVLTDNYYKNWRAYVDGEETEILRAYGSFRAVPISADTKQVLFKYDRGSYLWPRMITILTLLLVAGILAAYLVMYLKEKKKTGLAG